MADIIPLLDGLYPIHGLLLTEGEDVGPLFRDNQLSSAESDQLALEHPSDTKPDSEKDSIEFALVQRCLRDGIPLFAICRGSQLVNLACGGQVYSDVATQLPSSITHMDYGNYDGHRHPIRIVPDTPLANWFDNADEVNVNSYHHQGIARLSERFQPMAFAPDGLLEAYYDPQCYDVANGRFLVGLQFHPERMQDTDAALADGEAVFEYPGCSRPYRDFVEAATVFQRRIVEQNAFTALATLHMTDKHGERIQQKAISQDDANSNIISKPKAWRATRMRKQEFTKEEIASILRCGATVHGSTLVRGLLNDHRLEDESQDPLNNCHLQNDAQVGSAPATAENMRSYLYRERLRKRWRKVEQALQGLKDEVDFIEAEALLDKLDKLSMVAWRTAAEPVLG